MLGVRTTLFQDVTIGDYSYVSEGTYIGCAQIGKFCSIGHYCLIGMFEHPTDYVSTSPFLYGEGNIFGMTPLHNDLANPPIIGNDVWIGGQSIILQGVHIGDGAIIAGGAVVTKDVPPYAIVGGTPAKVIRMRFDQDKIGYLCRLRWWDLPVDVLPQYQSLFAAGSAWTVTSLQPADANSYPGDKEGSAVCPTK
ncbi:MAG: CatB-related O-acetyltransferase [Armatimonadota bacterium]